MFTEIPASKSSLARRRLVCGVGVNDANYLIRPRINNKAIMCPYYKKWADMISRCYSEKFNKRHQTYNECTVCDEWLVFSNFKLWMKTQDWQNKELDKDILAHGDKMYSPDTCLFVAPKINRLILTNNAIRGDYPLGVFYSKPHKRFIAKCKVNKKNVHLGLYDTAEEAHEVYKKFKYELIEEVALLQDEPLKSALLDYVIR